MEHVNVSFNKFDEKNSQRIEIELCIYETNKKKIQKLMIKVRETQCYA